MKILRKLSMVIGGASAVVLSPAVVMAASEAAEHGSDGHGEGGVIHFGTVFAMFALVLVAAKVGSFVERFGQPAVIGELLMGIALAVAGYLGWGFIDEVNSSEIIAFISSFGALLLLFSIGLESNLKELTKVGASSLKVAIVGAFLPFLVGVFLLGEIFYGGESDNAKYFLGAALVATSVGIPSSVLRQLKLTKTKAAQTFLGATVIDDVLGLTVLAVVSALAQGGEATPGLVLQLMAKSFGFLGASIAIGIFTTKHISKAFGKVSDGVGMKLSFALIFALIMGYLAEVMGLEPIIGAFAAGLLLDAVHFDHFEDPESVKDLKELEFEDKKDREKVLRLINKHKHTHVEDLINSIGLVFIPVFFLTIGLQINIESLLEPKLYVIAVIMAVVAFITKFVAGYASGMSPEEKKFIGVCMVPRGEVGLIFAAVGRSLGVLNDELFSVIVLTVMLTTFAAPPLVKKFGLQMIESKKM